MADIVREDVIKINLDSSEALKALQKIQDDIDNLCKGLVGVEKNDGIDKVTKATKQLYEAICKTEKPLRSCVENLKKLGKQTFDKLISGLNRVCDKLVDIGKKAIGTAYKGLKKLAGISFKAISTGITACTTAISGLVGLSVNAYGNYEQFVGGVETLFGAGGANTVEEYANSLGKSVSEVQDKFKILKESEAQVFKDANDAYKTAGLSANDYMETVTGFSASLISSLNGDTKKAAEYSNKAIVDMSDNANKMGSSMESIQNAYQGFAKQNYTMLDNLKLGYGGTQEEMKRLIKDAAKIDKSVKANDMSFGNIVLAIHAIQDSMDISETTKKEASTTIQGSFSSLRSAWGNLMTSLVVGGDSFDQCINNLINSALTFDDNIMPALQKALQGVAALITSLAPVVAEKFPVLMGTLLPPLLQSAISLLTGLIKSLPTIIKAIAKELPDMAKSIFSSLNTIFTSVGGADLFGGLIKDIKLAITTVTPTITNIINKVKEFISSADVLTKLKNAWDNIKKAIQAMWFVVEPILELIFNNLDKIVPVVIGIIKALAILKVAITVVNFVMSASPITWIILGFVALIAVIAVCVKHWDKISEVCSLAWGYFMEDCSNALNAVKQYFSGLCDKILGFFGIIGSWFNNKVLQPIKTGFLNAVNYIKDNVKSTWNKIVSVWGMLIGWVSSNITQPLVGFFSSLWVKIKEIASGIKEDIVLAFSEAWDKVTSIWEGLKDFFKGIWEGLKGTSSVLKDTLVGIFKTAVKGVTKPINKLIGGANWVLEKLGSDIKIAEWQPYAKGTDGHRGGNALVNDGRGAELVQMPNGSAFIPQGRNVFIPNAPVGMKVLPAEQTASFMGKSSPTFRYENGVGFDFWNVFGDAKGLVNKVIGNFVSFKGISGYTLNVGKAMINKTKGAFTDWVSSLFDKFGGKDISSYVPSEGVEQWRSTVIQALKMENLYTADNVKRALYQMQTESGGNPKAINLWDTNAKRGIPSKGLMQVIDPTFKSYARKGYDKNIYDPLSNILASIRYAVSRYGTLANAYKGVGYANGGIATKPSIFGEKGAEMAIPLTADKRNRALGLWQQTGEILGVGTSSNSGNTEYNFNFEVHINGTGKNNRELSRLVKQSVKEVYEEAIDSFKRKNTRITIV